MIRIDEIARIANRVYWGRSLSLGTHLPVYLS